jgi:GDP-L-fucose synthase
MEKSDKIYIAGHTGMLGTALLKALQAQGYSNLVVRHSIELDLRKSDEVEKFFKKEKPAYVFFAAGTVGGIIANINSPADFIFNNVSMITNTVHASWKYGVKKMLYYACSCIYPKNCPQPIKEEYILTGLPEETNQPYSIAKLAGIELCSAYNKQYHTNNIVILPPNLFGIGDNYDPQNSHLVGALIRKFYEAKLQNSQSVQVWGTGNPRREFLSSDSAAAAGLYFMNTYSGNDLVNIGTGLDYSIKEIAMIIKDLIEFKGEIIFDPTRPDGMMRKQLDVSRAKSLGWSVTNSFIDDLKVVVSDFISNYDKYTIQ